MNKGERKTERETERERERERGGGGVEKKITSSQGCKLQT